MTSDLQTQLFTTWLPLAIMVVFGIIGALRGAVREAIFAAVVAVAAFVDTQWAIQWGQSFNGVYNGWPQQGEQAYISILALWAIALIIGYGLGSLVPRQPIRPQSRLLGLLLGLLSGAAMAGWSLRLYITNTDGTLQPGALLDNIVSRSFIIWTSWFPVVLILLATIVVLVGPLRRMQGAVGEPSEATDWAPNAPARPAGAPVAVGYSPTGTAVLPYPTGQGPSPAAPVTTQVPVAPFNPAPSQSASSTQTYGTYGNYDNFDSTRTRAFTPQPEPPTALLATREAAGSLPAQEEEKRDEAPRATSSPSSRDTAHYSTFDSSNSGDSSWLLQAVDSSKQEDEARAEATTAEPPAPAASPEPVRETRQIETFAPVSAQGEPQANASDADASAETSTGPRCPNCGSTVIPGASFCTNCGTRLAS